MLYGSRDFAAFAAGKPLEAEIDSVWNYSSGTANIVARIVRQTAGQTTTHYYRFLYEQLFDRIGMYSAIMEPDASGTFVGSSYTYRHTQGLGAVWFAISAGRHMGGRADTAQGVGGVHSYTDARSTQRAVWRHVLA